VKRGARLLGGTESRRTGGRMRKKAKKGLGQSREGKWETQQTKEGEKKAKKKKITEGGSKLNEEVSGGGRRFNRGKKIKERGKRGGRGGVGGKRGWIEETRAMGRGVARPIQTVKCWEKGGVMKRQNEKVKAAEEGVAASHMSMVYKKL